MNAPFTPGPWTWNDGRLMPVTPDPDKHLVHTIVDSVEGVWTCRSFAAHDWASTQQQRDAEQRANLALVAAAPALFELLTHARCPHDGCQDLTLPNGDQCQWCTERAEVLAKVCP